MTRSEAIAHIRSVGRTCRGACVFNEKEREVFAEEGNRLLEPFNIQAAYIFKRRLEDRLQQYDKPAHNMEEMSQRFVQLIYARTDILGRPCGFDYNTFIEQGPWDGKVYTTTCPQCGTVDKYQAPHYQIQE